MSVAKQEDLRFLRQEWIGVVYFLKDKYTKHIRFNNNMYHCKLFALGAQCNGHTYFHDSEACTECEESFTLLR